MHCIVVLLHIYTKFIIIFFRVTKYCVLIHFLYDRKFLKFDMRNTTSYNDPIAKLMLTFQNWVSRVSWILRDFYWQVRDFCVSACKACSVLCCE